MFAAAFWAPEGPGESFVHTEVGLSEAGDFSVQSVWEDFMDALIPVPTSSTLVASRRRPLSLGDVRSCQ